jgi:hypothetical protein
MAEAAVLEQLVPQEWELLVLQVFKVSLDQMEPLEYKVRPEQPVLVQQVVQDHRASQAQPEQQARKAVLEQLVPQEWELLVLQVFKVSLDQMEPLAQPEQPVLVQQVVQDHRAPQAQPEQQARKETRVLALLLLEQPAQDQIYLHHMAAALVTVI